MATYNATLVVNNSDTYLSGINSLFVQDVNLIQVAATGQPSLVEALDNLVLSIAIPITYTLNVGATTTEIIFTQNTSVSPFPVAIGLATDQTPYVYAPFIEAVQVTPLVTCETCAKITKLACQTSYNFKAQLTPNTNYWVALSNNKNKTYSAQITSDSIGGLTIDATAIEFPEGMWIPESGIYTMRVYSDAEMTTQELFTFDTTGYYCIELSFTYNQTFTSDITGVYLLRTDDVNLTVIVDENGSAISIG